MDMQLHQPIQPDGNAQPAPFTAISRRKFLGLVVLPAAATLAAGGLSAKRCLSATRNRPKRHYMRPMSPLFITSVVCSAAALLVPLIFSLLRPRDTDRR